MQLPGNSIGISDILAHIECPRRMSYGMRRHTGPAQQDASRTPEARNPGALYGSCVHDVLHAVGDGWSDDDAIQSAWNVWGAFLEPEDLDLLRVDLETYHLRDFPATRLVLNEGEITFPLLEHEGVTINFRAKIDRLYEFLSMRGVFVHIDYKSSKWAKSQDEVHSDKQLWSYNLGIYEAVEGVETLHQFYDQLRYGQIPTRKNAQQREQIREWLQRQVRRILEDERWQPDGMLPYKYNEWCPYCPLLESCGVVGDLTDYALQRIAALAPTTQEGRKLVMELEPHRLDEYVGQLEPTKAAIKVLERYAKSVRDLLVELPVEERLSLGYDVAHRRETEFDPAALKRVHGLVGDRFYSLVRLSKAAIERTVEDPADQADVIAEGLEKQGAAVLKKAGGR